MNENAKAWVAALRSERYKQCRGDLQNKEEFCVLGVACDLYLKAGHTNLKTEINVDESVSYIQDDGKRYNGHLPTPVGHWLGIKTRHGACTQTGSDGEPVPTSLIALNDRKRWSLPSLADFIEEHQDELFHEDTNDAT